MPPERKFDHAEAQKLRAAGWGVGEIAQKLGVTKGAISQATRPVDGNGTPVSRTPQSYADMLALAKPQLYAYFKASSGIAKMQAYNAIRDLARAEAGADGEKPPEPLIGDVVSGAVNVPPSRKRQVLTEERLLLRAELARIEEALASIPDEVLEPAVAVFAVALL